jgi:hypothetical protein
MKNIPALTLAVTGLVATTTLLVTSLGSEKGVHKKDIMTPALREQLKTAPKIYAPTPPSSPVCPASVGAERYTVAQAADQTEFVTTAHCTKCGLGALFEQENQMVCSYCREAS